jgi:hypothetical protein
MRVDYRKQNIHGDYETKHDYTEKASLECIITQGQTKNYRLTKKT